MGRSAWALPALSGALQEFDPAPRRPGGEIVAGGLHREAEESHHRLFRSAGRVSAAVFLSRITGLVREMVMARLFGAGAVYDAFLLGFRIPNLTRDLFAEGALSSAFVPTFTEYLTNKGKRAAAELSNLVGTALIVVVGGLCIAGIFGTPQLVRLLAPGFLDVPGKFELAVLLTRIMFPFLLLVSLAAQAMGVLNACGRFGMPALSSTWFNVGSVAVGLALGLTAGRLYGHGLIVCMAIGIVAGGAFQLLWQVPGLRRAGFHFQPRWGPRHPGLRQMLRLMLPAMLGNAAVQINVLVNTNFASSIRDASGNVINGPVSWLGYAFRFMQLPLGLFGVALASATLPAISRSAAAKRMDEFGATLTRSLGTALLLTVPSSVGLAVLGESMIGVVYQWGRFRAVDTHQTAVALAWYSAGLAGYAAIKLLAPAFYALNDARTPMLVSAGSIAINLTVAYLLVRRAGMGHAGLALSTSAVAMAGALILLGLLRRRVHGLAVSRLGASAAKILAAAAVMGVACRVSSGLIHEMLGVGKAAQFADVAVSIPLGVSIFYAVARLLQVEELDGLLRVVARKPAR
ncbi:MAG TPA: murein biosynthesis integral membrane protein MurJ [Candidatus Sulfopaludibacter sp.]|nr:murein biosynthesis integral membrane protein MurJ [Candidatus Sulfopaludibacter sp.]